MRALVIHGKWVEKSGEATPCVIVRERAPAGCPFFLSYCESFRELRRRRTGWKVLRKSSDSGNALVCTLRVPDVRSRGRRESLVYSQRRTRPVVRGISGLSPPLPPRRAHARAPPRGRSADTRRPRGVCRQPLPLCRRLLSCSLRPGCSCPSLQLPVCGVRAGSGSLAPPGLVRGQRTWTCAALATRRRCGPTETAEAGARGGVWG